MPLPLANVNAKLFREHLHSKFKVLDGAAETILLELVDAVEGNTSPKLELFSVYFRGPFTPRLPQQIHRLEHEKLGIVEMFLTPIEADQEKGTTYESVFHRFRKAQ